MNFYFGGMGFNPDNAAIVRDTADEGPTLLDADYQPAWTFPLGWTDEQVKSALLFAEAAYVAGVKEGELRKQQEIAQMLARQD